MRFSMQCKFIQIWTLNFCRCALASINKQYKYVHICSFEWTCMCLSKYGQSIRMCFPSFMMAKKEEVGKINDTEFIAPFPRIHFCSSSHRSNHDYIYQSSTQTNIYTYIYNLLWYRHMHMLLYIVGYGTPTQRSAKQAKIQTFSIIYMSI